MKFHDAVEKTNEKTQLCPFSMKCFCGVSSGTGQCCHGGEAVPDEVQLSRAGRLALLSRSKLPFPRDLVASLKQNPCSYGKLRHSKASIPTKCLWLCWQSAGRVLDTWMLELIYFAKRSP